MKTKQQMINESVLEAFIARRNTSLLSNKALGVKHDVSATTIANKIKSVGTSIDRIEAAYDEGIIDSRFYFDQLDHDIAIVVIDKMKRCDDPTLIAPQVNEEAIRAQFARIQARHKDEYRKNKELARELGIG